MAFCLLLKNDVKDSEPEWVNQKQITGINIRYSVRDIPSLFPGNSQILSGSGGENFSPQLQDKIWEWPGNEARVYLGTHPVKGMYVQIWTYSVAGVPKNVGGYIFCVGYT